MLPETPQAVLAGFFWALFGHPDKHVRWRALHAARLMLWQPNPALLRALIALINTITVGPYRSDQLEFYWMSARLWFLILLLRLADERPLDLADHVDVLVDQAINRSFPHAQIREVARRALLRLADTAPHLVPYEEAEQLRFNNVSTMCLVPVPGSEGPHHSATLLESGKWTKRFSFWIDTVEYWYSAVASIFDRPTREVLEHAETWICDHWGRSDSDWRQDRRELSGRYERREMRIRRGDVPDVEMLQFYLEYHALFCVAGSMIATLPVTFRHNDDGPLDPWEDWLKDHLNQSDRYWQADLRSQTPLRPDCWGRFPPIEQWLRYRDPADYDAALGLNEPGRVGQMVVLGEHDIGDAERQGTVRVTSALVNGETARSLMHALQMSDAQTYMLPTGRGNWNETESDEPGFELQSWLDERPMTVGLDAFDPLGRIGESSLPTFGDDFLARMQVRPSPGGTEFTRPDGAIAGQVEIWNDSVETERVTEPFSKGKRLWLHIDMLLAYLRERELDLIIKVKIARNRRERNYGAKDDAYDLGHATIYLFRRDGSFETVAGRRDLRAADRSRA